MFEGVQAKWPRILPLLEPEWAADKIVSAIRCNQWELLMPLILHIVPVLRGLLPLAVSADLAEWFGVLDTMDDFKGRAPRQAYPVDAAPNTSNNRNRSNTSKKDC